MGRRFRIVSLLMVISVANAGADVEFHVGTYQAVLVAQDIRFEPALQLASGVSGGQPGRLSLRPGRDTAHEGDDPALHLDGDGLWIHGGVALQVIEQTVGETLPEGFQTAEFLIEKGALDMIIDRRKARDELAAVLSKLMRLPEPA